MQLEQLELTGGGTLTLYLRESVEAMPHFRQRPLVLVVPGGGYNHVSPREGDPVALQFAAAGYHTAVLHYAVGESARDALPMRQLAQAIGLVRQHAEQWNILPDQIALCGFFCRRASGTVRCSVGDPRHGRPAAAQRPAAGLPGGHRR